MQKSPENFAVWYGIAASILIVLGLGACDAATDTTAAPASAERAPTPGCGTAGFLQTRLYGEISANLDWSSADLECEGMPRPNDAGARLRFAGEDRDGDRQLAFIVAIPELDRDSAGRELDSTITLIEEGGGRFFSTASTGNCVTEVSAMTSLDDAGNRVAISGTVYCVSPLAEVNGDSSVSITELRFGGLIDWSSS